MQNEHTREELFAYIDAWKAVLEASQKTYIQLQSGSMSGIVLIVATIGFNFDNISKLQGHEKGLLVVALLCLTLALGNILNCVRTTNFLEGLFGGTKSRLIYDDQEIVPHAELEKLRGDVLTRFVGIQKYYTYSYWCFFFAVLLGIFCFFSIMIRL